MKERLEAQKQEILETKAIAQSVPHEFFDKHEERIKNKFEEEKERVI